MSETKFENLVDIDVIYLIDEAAYCVVVRGEAHGKELVWKLYTPDQFVISDKYNGQYYLTDSAMAIVKPIAELTIEMTAVKLAAA